MNSKNNQRGDRFPLRLADEVRVDGQLLITAGTPAMGEVVRPAEPIMEIVPDEDKMIVEVAINPADVDQVAKGQKARIRLAFESPPVRYWAASISTR